jgi:hypothetical protein
MDKDLAELLRMLKSIKSREEYAAMLQKKDFGELMREAKPTEAAEVAAWCLEVGTDLVMRAQEFLERRCNVSAELEECSWPMEREPAPAAAR